MSNLVTFGLVGEEVQKLKETSAWKYSKLKESAKVACNFWNGHIDPSTNIVLQIGVFTDTTTTTIARAWRPFEENGVKYGKIEFNTKFLNRITFISTVFIHEICHTLGFGWESLDRLYSKETGLFHQEYIDRVPELKEMKIELDYGPATKYAHWDEETFGEELMTGIKSYGNDYVLPVTIKIMNLLGHKVIVVPEDKLKLNDKTIKQLSKIEFSRQRDVSLIDTLYEKKTELVEEREVKYPWWMELLKTLFD